MDKKDVITSILGLIFLLIAFFIGFSSVIGCIGPQPYPCNFGKIVDILDFLLFSVLVIAMPLLYIVGSVDLIASKKIFRTRKSFIITFGLIIIIYSGIIFATGCKSHCTLEPTEHYIRMELLKLETGITSESKRIETYYGSIRHETFTSEIVDKICFSKDNTLKIFSKEELLKTVDMNNLQLDEDPLCFEMVNNEFGIRFEGLGDKTKISKIPTK